MSRKLWETDALVRQIEGYSRVFDDPPGPDKLAAKMRIGAAIRNAFADLNARLRAGEALPEVWDPVTRRQRREQFPMGDVTYVYPPGTVGPAPCAPNCVWIAPFAPVTACTRCHTIKYLRRGTVVPHFTVSGDDDDSQE